MIRTVFLHAVALLALALSAHAQMAGDTNCDGSINGGDLNALVGAVFDAPAETCRVDDANGDDRAGGADLVAILKAMRRSVPGGPAVTYFGIAGASGGVIAPLGFFGQTPVFYRSGGSGFRLVVEAANGTNNVSPGDTTLERDSLDPSRRPDLQVVCTNALGDGDTVVCDNGVPATQSPHFDSSDATSFAINDLGCHFNAFTSATFGCTTNQFGNASFVSTRTRLQFCALISRPLEFPLGDTLCSAQVRDVGGTLGPQTQLIMRVGSGPMPPTFTATSAATATSTRGSSATPTVPVPTATRTPTINKPSPSPTPTTGTTQPSHTATLLPGASATPTQTPSRTKTATVGASFTPTLSRTSTVTNTPTRTATRTLTSTPVGPAGPIITFMGLARADDTLVQPTGTAPDGTKIYTAGASGFRLVVEAKPRIVPCMLVQDCVGPSTFIDPSLMPDFQILTSRALGNGSKAVCDSSGSAADRGGVPATTPLVFSNTPVTIGAINDLSCRFLDGNGAPFGRESSLDSCVANSLGDFVFVVPTPRPQGVGASIQYCAAIDRSICFPMGDTILVARARDELGITGEPSRIIVRNEVQVCP